MQSWLAWHAGKCWSIFGSKPSRKGFKRSMDILHFAQPTIDPDFSIDVFDGKSQRCCDAFDLAAHDTRQSCSFGLLLTENFRLDDPAFSTRA
jgi:hypothetical protein